jgi:hypothetical protein
MIPTLPETLNSLTLGELRALAAMFQPPAESQAHPFAGRYCIFRCYSAGVHAGVLVSQSGDQATVRDARRLWSWKAKDGVALSGLAAHGLARGKIDTLVTEIALTGVIETIPCTDAARESITNAR